MSNGITILNIDLTTDLTNKGTFYQFDMIMSRILRSVKDDDKNYWLARRLISITLYFDRNYKAKILRNFATRKICVR